jgi:methyl-accepting chemotaxis protein
MCSIASNQVQCKLEPILATAYSLAGMMGEVMDNVQGYSRKQVSALVAGYLNNENVSGVWVETEPNRYDGRDAEYVRDWEYRGCNGRFDAYWYQGEKGAQLIPISVQNPNDNEFYSNTRQRGKPTITDPYADPEVEDLLLISLTAPFSTKSGTFVGVAGVDIPLTVLSEVIDTVRPFERGRMTVIAGNGTWASHPKHEQLGQDIGNTPFMRQVKESLQKDAIYFEDRYSDILQEDAVSVFVPINFELSGQRWGLLIDAPNAVVLRGTYEIVLFSVISVVITLFLLIIVINVIIKRIVNNMKKIFTRLTEVVGDVRSTSSDVADGSQRLSAGTSAQAAVAEEITASLVEMSSSIKANADSAAEANTLTENATIAVDNTYKGMQNSLAANQEIAQASNETYKIIKTIDEIAFQTNLLSLNAAVEAARAGEAGAGFAVVADEVRGLSMRSADASKQTAEMIEETISKVREGIGVFKENEKNIDAVVEQTHKTRQLIGEIAHASSEQSKGIEQIRDSVAEMARVIQENASTSEKSATSAKVLDESSNEMLDNIRLVDDYVFGEQHT